jgi:hypothetical protein
MSPDGFICVESVFNRIRDVLVRHGPWCGIQACRADQDTGEKDAAQAKRSE